MATLDSSLLLTPAEVKLALKDTYSLLQDKDSKKRWRHEQTAIKRVLLAGGNPFCAACGNSNHKPEVAHIESLEEGGDSQLTNLVFLCHKCHSHYDKGYASQEEMERARELWSRGQKDPTLGWLMQERCRRWQSNCRIFAETYVTNLRRLISEDKHALAAQEAQNLLERAEAQNNIIDQFYFKLKLIEIGRRRALRGAIDDAERQFEELRAGSEAYLLCPDFFYQGGYVNFELGRHARALELFEESQRLARRMDSGSGIRMLAAGMLIIHVTIASREGVNYDELEKTFINAEQQLQRFSGRVSNQWRHNVSLARVRFELARQNISAAEKAWEKARALWKCMTVFEGWEEKTRATIVRARANLLAAEARAARGSEKCKKAKAALPFLARAVVSLVGQQRQFPQELRDLMFSTADMLDTLGWSDHACRSRIVAERVREGVSWMHAFTAPSRAANSPASD